MFIQLSSRLCIAEYSSGDPKLKRGKTTVEVLGWLAVTFANGADAA